MFSTAFAGDGWSAATSNKRKRPSPLRQCDGCSQAMTAMAAATFKICYVRLLAAAGLFVLMLGVDNITLAYNTSPGNTWNEILLKGLI